VEILKNRDEQTSEKTWKMDAVGDKKDRSNA